MYNRLYNYFIENNILYSKQFGFQNGHSTENETQNLRPKTMDTCHIWDLRSRALIRTKKKQEPTTRVLHRRNKDPRYGY